MNIHDQAKPTPGMCRRIVSDHDSRFPHFSPCRRKAGQDGLCAFHRSLDERTTRKSKDWEDARKTSVKNEREGRALARRLGLRGTQTYYNTVGPLRKHGYVRSLVVSFDELRKLVDTLGT
jgi:hypothetical protein